MKSSQSLLAIARELASLREAVENLQITVSSGGATEMKLVYLKKVSGGDEIPVNPHNVETVEPFEGAANKTLVTFKSGNSLVISGSVASVKEKLQS